MDVTLIPPQQKGIKTGVSAQAEAPTRHDAIILFERARERLLHVNGWQELAGPGSAEFRLCDAGGAESTRARPEVGDLIRIRLPAPPNGEGRGFDWVRVEAFESSRDLLKDEDTFGFRVRPVADPVNPGGNTAHFYTSAATSTFLVLRASSTVKAMERGRNEIPNSWPAAIITRVRNVAVALGAWLGLSHSQWGRLVRGIIRGPAAES